MKVAERAESGAAAFVTITLKASPVEIALPNGGIVRLPLGVGQAVLVEVIRAVGAPTSLEGPQIMTDFSDVRIFLCTTPTNMNCSFDHLMGRAQDIFASSVEFEDDVGEQHDLGEKDLAKAAELLDKLHSWQRKLGAKMPQPMSP